MPTMLLADDSVTTQRVIALTFAGESFRVVTVSDGQHALDAMVAQRPDIVLVATSLPRTNGYELARQMHEIEQLRDVPVLLLSGAFESVDAAKLEASGARGVIEKPIEPNAVINRVRELLGLKDTLAAPPAGRLVTPADAAAEPKPPSQVPHSPGPREAPASPWDELRESSGLERDARSVEGAAGADRDDYLDMLDDAFDSLDQQLADRAQGANPGRRNPSLPLARAAGAADPRSPGRGPATTNDDGTRKSVFEVDGDWFAGDPKARDLAAHRDMAADAHEVMPPRPPAGDAIVEVDDEWFAEDEKARESRAAQQRVLAAEMGIHEIELPEAEPVPNKPAPAEGLDFDFGLDDLMPAPAKPGPVAESPLAPLTGPAVGPQPVGLPPVSPPALAPVAQASVPPAANAPASVAVTAVAFREVGHPLPPAHGGSVADDFAALLAFETGDTPALPPVLPHTSPTDGHREPPAITEAMLDQIAQRVAERLDSGQFGAGLRDLMAATIRETVRSVVSETSERLVRDEIARIRSQAQP